MPSSARDYSSCSRRRPTSSRRGCGCASRPLPRPHPPAETPERQDDTSPLAILGYLAQRIGGMLQTAFMVIGAVRSLLAEVLPH